MLAKLAPLPTDTVSYIMKHCANVIRPVPTLKLLHKLDLLCYEYGGKRSINAACFYLNSFW